MIISVSAPGKIHLLGEHAVVYGYPALLASIDRRVYVKMENGKWKMENENEILIKSIENNLLIRKAIKIFKTAYSIKRLPRLKITISSQIPTGSGLGSSAAVSAATIGAFMKFVKNVWNPSTINELTFKVEKIAHGNPSGADNTAVVFGGLIWYRREFEFLKSIWSLPVSSYKIPRFVLIDTGRPKESTKEMVGGVAKLYKKNTRQMEEIFVDQEKQTKRLLLAFRERNTGELKKAIMMGERNLEKMEVVGEFARKVARSIEKIGAAAKICGAGGKKKGSGMMLAYHEKLSSLYALAEKLKIPIYPVILAGEGIRMEKNKCLNA
jgi:mevalonate kinase